MQCFPRFVYDADGTRRDNVMPHALARFRAAAHDATLTADDLFHYVYGLLHAPGYRTRFAENLRRSLPRIPFVADAAPFIAAGRALAALHVGFESAPEFPLGSAETPGEPLSLRVETMRWADAGKTALRVNAFLTLTGLPPEAHRYRLGNRSALDWLVDGLRIKTDTRSGLVHDPNDASDPSRIVRLIGQVTQVSVETVRIVEALPAVFAAPEPA